MYLKCHVMLESLQKVKHTLTNNIGSRYGSSQCVDCAHCGLVKQKYKKPEG
jgi:hypothetical protein